jgi:hypothetical protein
MSLQDAEILFRLDKCLVSSLEDLLAIQMNTLDIDSGEEYSPFQHAVQGEANDIRPLEFNLKLLIQNVLGMLYIQCFDQISSRSSVDLSDLILLFILSHDCVETIDSRGTNDAAITVKFNPPQDPFLELLLASEAHVLKKTDYLSFPGLDFRPVEGSEIHIIPLYRRGAFIKVNGDCTTVSFSVDSPPSWLTWDDQLACFRGTVPSLSSLRIERLGLGSDGTSNTLETSSTTDMDVFKIEREGGYAIVQTIRLVVKAVLTEHHISSTISLKRTLRARITLKVLPWYTAKEPCSPLTISEFTLPRNALRSGRFTGSVMDVDNSSRSTSHSTKEPPSAQGFNYLTKRGSCQFLGCNIHCAGWADNTVNYTNFLQDPQVWRVEDNQRRPSTFGPSQPETWRRQRDREPNSPPFTQRELMPSRTLCHPWAPLGRSVEARQAERHEQWLGRERSSTGSSILTSRSRSPRREKSSFESWSSKGIEHDSMTSGSVHLLNPEAEFLQATQGVQSIRDDFHFHDSAFDDGFFRAYNTSRALEESQKSRADQNDLARHTMEDAAGLAIEASNGFAILAEMRPREDSRSRGSSSFTDMEYQLTGAADEQEEGILLAEFVTPVAQGCSGSTSPCGKDQAIHGEVDGVSSASDHPATDGRFNLRMDDSAVTATIALSLSCKPDYKTPDEAYASMSDHSDSVDIKVEKAVDSEIRREQAILWKVLSTQEQEHDAALESSSRDLKLEAEENAGLLAVLSLEAKWRREGSSMTLGMDSNVGSFESDSDEHQDGAE